MLANIHIDDVLMQDAMKLSGTKTQQETIEKSLKLLVKMYQQQQIRELRGKLNWEGDLKTMRDSDHA